MFVLGWSQTLQSWILTFPKFGVIRSQGLDSACWGGEAHVYPVGLTYLCHLLSSPTYITPKMLRIWGASPSCGTVLPHSSA